MSSRLAVGLCCLLCLASPVLGGNWPSFRGPRASGIGQAEDPPLTWDATAVENVLWKTPIPGLSHASPVVWGEQIFVTTAVSAAGETPFRPGLYGDVDPVVELPRQSWRLYALDKTTGNILWQRTAAEGSPKTKRHPKASFANSTPATDGRRVVALFASQGLYCYDVEGKLLWQRDLGLLDAGWFFNADYQWGYASSPIIWRDLVIVQADIQRDSFVAAFRLDDGRQVWRTPRREIPSWGSPNVLAGDKGPELVTNGAKFLRAYDPATGKELWRLQNRSEITVATPVGSDGLVFFSNGYRPVPALHAVRLGSRGDISLEEGQSSNRGVAWYKDRGGTYLPTPIVIGDYLYTLSNNGVLTCYEASSGERVYRQRVGRRGGAFSASPVAAAGRLYLSSEDGDVFVVKAGPEYELLATNPVGEVLMATPAISDDLLILRGRNHVIAIGEGEGKGR